MANNAAPTAGSPPAAAQSGPQTGTGPDQQTQDPQGRKRKNRPRQKTRIARAKEAAAAEAAARAAQGQADQTGEDDQSAGDQLEDAQLVACSVVGDAESDVLGGSSVALSTAEDLPVSEHKKGKAPDFDYDKRAIAIQRDAEQALYEQVVDRDNQIAAFKQSLFTAESEISRLTNAVNDLNNDIYDEERGFAVQLDSAAAKAGEDEQAIKSLRRELSQASSTIDSTERARADLLSTIKDLSASLKAKEAEIDRLQTQNGELVNTINNPEPDPELEACKEELEQYEAFDGKINEQLDQILQGLVSKDDTFDKLDVLSKALNDARDAAERNEAARDAAQSELDKTKSQRPSLSFSPFTSVVLDPVTLPKVEHVSTGSQTSPVRLTLSKLTSVNEEPTPRPSTVAAGTQTSPVKLALSQLSSLFEEEPIIPDFPTMASASTQTDVVNTVGTSTQTEPPKTVAASTQTAGKKTISAATQTVEKKMTSTLTQTRSNKMTSASTQTAKPATASSPAQTVVKVMHSAAVQTDLTLPPQQALQALAQDTKASIKHEGENRVTITQLRRKGPTLLTVLGNPLFLTVVIIMLAYMWDILPRVIDNPEHWSMPGYRSDMYRRDLARVDFGTWLGVDRSFIG